MREVSRLALAGAACLVLGGLLAPRWVGPTAAQEKAAKGSAYHMLLVGAGNGSEVVRFRADTGEAWMPKNLVWQKIAEADNLPAGDYDVQMVGLPAVNGFEITRLERGSGRGWIMRNSKWVEITDSK